MITIRSRINEFFTKTCLEDLYKICNDKRHSNNNKKVDAVVATLHKHQVDFVELGPGTNRYAILIDGFVFKIALDRWGMQDNLNEFTVTQEIQPYVVKTYETNELISVCEYVTVISREEFENNLEGIKQTLAILSEGYLLGDVGIMMKNFCNWGYRDNGELCILDFAYIYRIVGEEMLCSSEGCDNVILDYDDKFHNLLCPKCRRKYTFIDIRRKIPVAHEKAENEMAKQIAYKLTTAKEIFDETNDSEEENENEKVANSKEDEEMKKQKVYDMYNDVENEEHDEYDDYMASLNLMKKITGNDDESRDNDVLTSMIEEIVEEKELSTPEINSLPKMQSATRYGYVGNKTQEEIDEINKRDQERDKAKEKEFEETTDEIDEIITGLFKEYNGQDNHSSCKIPEGVYDNKAVTINTGVVNIITEQVSPKVSETINQLSLQIGEESERINQRPKSIDFNARENEVNVVYSDEPDTSINSDDSVLAEALKEALTVAEEVPEVIKEVLHCVEDKIPERSAASRMREIAMSDDGRDIYTSRDSEGNDVEMMVNSSVALNRMYDESDKEELSEILKDEEPSLNEILEETISGELETSEEIKEMAEEVTETDVEEAVTEDTTMSDVELDKLRSELGEDLINDGVYVPDNDFEEVPNRYNK